MFHCRSAIAKDIQDHQVKTLLSLNAIWEDMGVYGEAKAARLKSFHTHTLVSFISILRY